LGEAEQSSSLTPGTRVGAYVVEERIGAGGFGEVFRARHPVVGSEVAIKVLNARYSADAEAVARFVAEARAVNQISHPNIIEIFDFGELSDGREYFVMELLAGTSLRDVLRDRTFLPFAEALPILRGIADAVDAAHLAGIAHRDLKPDNVFVLPDGRIKLIDFGLAKLTAENAVPITQTGAVFGTPLFMSPEQCRGRAVDARTDLYSFGVLAYCVLAGQPPFDGDALALALHHLNDMPEPPSRHRAELPSHVDRVVLELLAKDPAQRPSPLATAIAAIEGSIRLPRRMRRVWIALSVIVALGGAGIAWAMHSAPSPAAIASDCVPAAERITPFWSSAIADAAAPKFSIPDRPGVAQSWKLGRARVDELAHRWSQQWDKACHSTDRMTDALLYSQRIACLDNALFDLRNFVTSMIERPRDYRYDPNTDAGTGGRSLEDCENVAVLRAQVRPPPPAVRDRVNALLVTVLDVETTALRAVGTADADHALDQLDHLAREIEKLDPASASGAITWRAWMLRSLAVDVDTTRLPAAREALDDAIRRIDTNGDDVALAEIYTELMYSEMNAGDPGRLARADDAARRADSAFRRAGSPVQVQRDIADMHIDWMMENGQFATAIDASRAAIQLASNHFGTDGLADRQLVVGLALEGHDEEAIAEARKMLAVRTKALGDTNEFIGGYLLTLSVALDHAGLSAEALSSWQQLHDLEVRLGTGPPDFEVWQHAFELEIEMRSGARPADADSIVTSLATTGTKPAGQNPDGIATARRAGLFAVFTYAAPRPGLTDDQRHADNVATLAFERGDYASAMRAAAPCATKCTAWVAFSRWLAIPRDAPDLEQRLAKLETQYPARPAAIANTGVILASLGRWDAAKPKLEAARAKPSIWERQADLVELDTWLALARLHVGDRAGARPLLVEALGAISILHNSVEGFSYMLPVANFELAKLAWDENRTYSRVLAARARDGFARLGSFRDPQRLEVTQWLADHAN
jgi:tetratricopeptide (TPR) repeat protein